MLRIRRDREAGRMLAELIFGIILLSLCIAVPGTIFLPGRWYFLGGLIVGAVAAILLVINMYDSIDAAISMNEKRAKSYASFHGVIRVTIMAALLALAIWIDVYCFAGVGTGVLTLKLSGLLHKPIAKLFLRLSGIPAPENKAVDMEPGQDEELPGVTGMPGNKN